MDTYLNSLIERMKAATTCSALSAAAQDAIDSIKEAISDATDQSEALAALMVPPVDLATTILWIKSMIQTYVTPYETYLKQVEEYTQTLSEILQLMSHLAGTLDCAGKDLP